MVFLNFILITATTTLSSSSCGFCYFSTLESLNERKRKDKQIPGSNQRAEKTREYESVSNINCSWHAKNSTQKFGNKTKGIGDQIKDWDNTDHSIIKIGLNIQKSPGDLRRLAVT